MAYNDLSIQEKAQVIRAGVQNGLKSLQEIQAFYDASQPENEAGMRGMMKARMAMASEFGNPTARRMTNHDVRSYEFPDGERGNIYAGSYDKYVVPHIQDVNGQLQMVEQPWAPENESRTLQQSIRFETPEEARYFAEHYKDIAPMMSLYGDGGSIHIAPSKKGTFTAAATKHGKSVQAFASQVLAHKENYSPAMVKKANFARNASHWHKTGGPMYPFSYHELPGVRYDDGGFMGWLRSLIPSKQETTPEPEPESQGMDYAELRRRQAYAESRFDNNAKSKAGAVGMFQIVPAVLQDYNKANGTNYTAEQLKDQDINTAVRDWYMDSLAGREWVTKGGANDSIQYAKGLAAYNAGPTATLKRLNKAKEAGVDIYEGWDWLEHMPAETRDYVNFILRGQDNSAHRNDTMYQATKKVKSKEVEKLK